MCDICKCIVMSGTFVKVTLLHRPERNHREGQAGIYRSGIRDKVKESSSDRNSMEARVV